MGTGMGMGKWTGGLAFVLVSTALTVGVAEVGLRLAVNPSDFLQAIPVDDPVLGHRIEAGATGHDDLGFRNLSVPAQADIVAIGDSNTYGVAAPLDGSWPAQLATQMQAPVYNMGLGGYGPLQYLQLSRDAAQRFKPKVLVVAYYYGNDLFDAYNIAHTRPHWHSWRQSQPAATTGQPALSGGDAESEKRFGALRHWLARRSMVYGVIRASVLTNLATAATTREAGQMSPDIRWAWSDDRDGKPLRTVFAPSDRLGAVDTSTAMPAEGLAISSKALIALNDEAKAKGIRVLVVTLHTKEFMHCRYLRGAGAALPAAFVRLCEAEQRAQDTMHEALRTGGVPFVDVTAAMEKAIEQRQQIYPVDLDGHPNRTGYAVIASEVARALKQPGTPAKP